MTRRLATLTLSALCLNLACDVDDETVTRVGDGVIGQGLQVDEFDADDAIDGLDDVKAEDEPTYAYCDIVTNWNASWVSFEDQVIALINQKRAAGAVCGGVSKPKVPALTKNTKLRCAARKHSRDMGINNFFSHTGSNGSTFSQRITSAGYAWTAAGENIAAGQATPAAVVDAWMKSTGHCNNIMSAKYIHVGVGYYYSATSTYKHEWTQDFGKN